jgi:hypothetical protein
VCRSQDEAYVALTGALQEGQEAEDVKNAVLGDAASVLPGDTEIEVQLISFDPGTLTILIRFAKYGTNNEGATADDEEADAGDEGDAAAEGAADAPGGDEEKASKTPRAGKEKKGKKALGKGKSKKSVVASGPATQVSSARDAMGVRDFLVDCVRAGKKVGSGAIRGLAEGELLLKPACVFVGGPREETMWERKALYMSVLPALRNEMRRHRISLNWLDWHHAASSSSPNVPVEWREVREGQSERTPFGPPSAQVQPSQWRCVEAVDSCTLPVPDGTRRPLALILAGNSAAKPISAIDEYILRQRLPEALPPPQKDEPASVEGGFTRTTSAKGGKAALPVVQERPSLLQLVLARLGVGDTSGKRFPSRQ